MATRKDAARPEAHFRAYNGWSKRATRVGRPKQAAARRNWYRKAAVGAAIENLPIWHAQHGVLRARDLVSSRPVAQQFGCRNAGE